MHLRKKKKIGYALGGGAARGISHIGVLKVLEEYGQRPDVIAGTSMGAVVGALYASGLKAADIEELALGLDWKRILSLADITLPLSGLIQGKRVIALLESILGKIKFQQLKCSFACVTTDILTGRQVVLRDGSLIEALRATISIPGIFTPVRIDESYLVDGGLVNEVPVSVCREMGAGYVIGVNVIPEPTRLLRKTEIEKNRHENKLLNNIFGRDEYEREEPSEQTGRSLNSHREDIENAIRSLLQFHHNREPEKTSAMHAESGNARHAQPKAPTLIDVLSQTVTIAEYRVALENLKDADLAISPDTKEIGFWHFDKTAQAIAAGELAAREVCARQIKNLPG